MKPIAKVIQELRMPFQPEFVDWKVQSTNKDDTKALVVAYVDARDVSERLNKVCVEQWSTRFDPIVVDSTLLGVECALTIRDEKVALTRCDVGVGDFEDKRMGAGIKTLWSDAIKRAGVHFGINSCAYELPQIWISDEDYLYKTDKIRGLSNKGKAHLGERYKTWVHSQKVKDRFGPVYEL